MKQQTMLEGFKQVIEYAFEVVHEILVFAGRILNGQSFSSDADNERRRKYYEDEAYYRRISRDSGYYKDKH